MDEREVLLLQANGTFLRGITSGRSGTGRNHGTNPSSTGHRTALTLPHRSFGSALPVGLRNDKLVTDQPP